MFLYISIQYVKEKSKSDRKAIFRQFPWASGDALNVFYAAEMHKRKYLTKAT